MSGGSSNVVHTRSELHSVVASWRNEREKIALVPTMGALHAGHLALVQRARELADKTVVSIFVNPTQFGVNEDFGRYPRDEAGDIQKLKGADCDLVYIPSVEDIYPQGFSTTVDPGPIAERLCGRFRPGHFAGVATVVTKLLLQSQAEIACFGEKDFQQLQIIRCVVRDLNLPVVIEGVPVIREADGLALSSRNHYLNPEQRKVAPALYRALEGAARRIASDAGTIESVLSQARDELENVRFAKLEYVEICDVESLEPVRLLDRPARLLAAIWLGQTRLIDNLPVVPPMRRSVT